MAQKIAHVFQYRAWIPVQKMGRGVVCIIIYCKTTELTETDDKADG